MRTPQEERGERLIEALGQSVFSPSGRESNRTRKDIQAALRRRMIEPLRDGYQRHLDEQPAIHAAERPTYLRQHAAELRRLADLGMRPRIHRRLADQYEAEADRLEASA